MYVYIYIQFWSIPLQTSQDFTRCPTLPSQHRAAHAGSAAANDFLHGLFDGRSFLYHLRHGRAGQLNSCTNGIQLWLREKTEPLVVGAITILISPREWERTANGGWNGLIYQYWLVVQCAHLEKWWSSSMGRMTSLFYEMDNKSHVWNHQPVIWFPVDVPLNQCNWQW